MPDIGIPDEDFLRGDVPMTKQEVRILTIAKARLHPKDIIYDIGAGTGSLSIEGLHFKILSMRAANEVSIQTSQDALFTGIYGTRGDYICKLDQGTVKIRDVETGESHTEQKFLEWKVSPQTAVRIQRAVPEIGENMAVTIMTFDAAGNLKNRCAFAENRFEVNSGELAPNDKNSQSELEKKAAEATAETAAVETEAVDAVPEDDGGDSSGGSSDDDLEF